MEMDLNLQRARVTVLLLAVFWFMGVLVAPTTAIWLTLASSGAKCVSEEIQSNVVVLADYVVIDSSIDVQHHYPTIAASVTSPYGNNLHHNVNATYGQFAFTTSEAGKYLACFWVDSKTKEGSTISVSVSLDWRTGIAAKDWDSIARKEKIEGVELELRKLGGAVESIHENMIYLKKREANMREVSEKTNGRVAWFSILSLSVCIVVPAVQLWHLKRYFQKKKLL